MPSIPDTIALLERFSDHKDISNIIHRLNALELPSNAK